ncbi:hypothetical protein [uncultured Actinomyces sp.]|uniref:hypothetical protein n=1 Tax=uncultured Actinomyces sp. TaxID=249061 RepID=UPI0037DC26CE
MAPVTRRSDTSIRDEFPARSGNKHLKRSLFLSGFAALRSDPVTRSQNGPRARNKHKPHSSACPAAAATSCSPCSATKRPTAKRPTARPPLSRLDEALSVAASAGVVCTDEYFLHPDPYPTRED